MTLLIAHKSNMQIVVRQITMGAIVLLVGLLVASAQAEALTKYCLGSFNSDANWSQTSGGANNTTHPGVSDVATFTSGGNTNCAKDAVLTIIGLDVMPTDAQRCQGNRSARLTSCPTLVIKAGGNEPIVEWMTDRPVWRKSGWDSLIRSQVSLSPVGTLEKIPTTMTSSPWTANTMAGRSFVVRRSVKGNLTRTTPPRWYSPMRVEVVLLAPFGERRFGKRHHLQRLQPLLYTCHDGSKLLRGELSQQVLNHFRRDFQRQFCHLDYPSTWSLA